MSLQLTLEPGDYVRLKAALRGAPKVTILSTGNVGTVQTPDVELGFEYDGVSKLDVTLVKKCSVRAKLLSEGALMDRVRNLFDKFLGGPRA